MGNVRRSCPKIMAAPRKMRTTSGGAGYNQLCVEPLCGTRVCGPTESPTCGATERAVVLRRAALVRLLRAPCLLQRCLSKHKRRRHCELGTSFQCVLHTCQHCALTSCSLAAELCLQHAMARQQHVGRNKSCYLLSSCVCMPFTYRCHLHTSCMVMHAAIADALFLQ